ncbi:acyltransferase [Oenococcus sp.]|uniref:acyltransferase n=1 Tax=Oenococcus sp. TaxID=1979414 RepID=UPI0039E931E5
MNNRLTVLQKLNIYRETAIKILRGFWCRIFFADSKSLLFIGKHVSLHNRRHIHVGRNVKFEALSEVQGLSTHGIVLGNNVTIGYGTQIRPSSYYGVGHIGFGLEMGDNSSIGPMGFVGCSGSIKIGSNVMIGPNVSMIAENHNFADSSQSIKEQGVNQKGIVIEDDVWIGTNVVILDGVRIGKGAIVGAGSLVSRDLSAKSILIDKRERYIKRRT